ncbi:hypothetical protein ANCDUO_08175 [Ancylostoma duodenale]|uniref:Zinc knuckle n=1 Tax=Ancylostoma duodenale TaxID=51022 RepID=A0A0C2CX40_9BILA|nr:hypothetical protein ANCDUO_08175 [Ancylostoma duodenale]
MEKNTASKLKGQLRETQEELRQLQRAILPLPEPQQLYEKIVSQCFGNYACTAAVTRFEDRVRRLRFADIDYHERYHALELLDHEVDHLRSQILFCRSQLRTLFSLPPLLIAMKKISKECWKTLIRQTPEVAEDKPLLMDPETIEAVITDHLQTLGELRSMLKDIRAEVDNEKDKADGPSKENAMQREPAERCEQEEVRREDENDIIQENTNFMEGVNDHINEPDNDDAQNEDNGRGLEDHQEDEPEYQGRAEHIEAEVRSLDDGMTDLRDIIRELENEPTCPARNFEHGQIDRPHERFMRCAFCGAEGSHYSDSCTVVPEATARREVVHDRRACEMCLEWYCARNTACPKYRTRCYYCREYGHHSSLCGFPERSGLRSKSSDIDVHCDEIDYVTMQLLRLNESEDVNGLGKFESENERKRSFFYEEKQKHSKISHGFQSKRFLALEGGV